jgi:hypothetical protein
VRWACLGDRAGKEVADVIEFVEIEQEPTFSGVDENN